MKAPVMKRGLWCVAITQNNFLASLVYMYTNIVFLYIIGLKGGLILWIKK